MSSTNAFITNWCLRFNSRVHMKGGIGPNRLVRFGYINLNNKIGSKHLVKNDILVL